MPKFSADAIGIKSHYATQIAADLERNTREQEEISSQLTALKDQLLALQNDHTLLVHMEQSLSNSLSAAGRDGEANGSNGHVKPAEGGRAPASAVNGAGNPVKETGSPKKRAKYRRADGSLPLRELVSMHLAEHEGPRSAAEVAAAVSEAHPERNVSIAVVRNTLENLVAKSEASRTKQQKSVFYSIIDGMSVTQS
ncbi:hypothetical protein OG462_43750 [Streptomyces sp. NBC_01077]|uniref:hypothetical protein n=1 Tax=Streptomyces sp. NBC_01077 TaxID=2903746 RepID=UPI0038654D1F|nr:hypothetical protein OG462_01255 [Streptomyces sp. NBC_01077]WSV43668.1 hypothetical protein OG462_43750 [Streptomyces sp. NBC_01077]